MPRKKAKPAEVQPAEVSTGGIPEIVQVAEAEAPRVETTALAVPDRTPDTSFDTAAFEDAAEAKTEPEANAPEAPKPRGGAFGVARLNDAGMSVELEMEPRRAWMRTRVLVRFDDDARPSEGEKAVLTRAGFQFDSNVKAWVMPKTAVSVLLAKRAVNEIAGMRGVEGPGLYL